MTTKTAPDKRKKSNPFRELAYKTKRAAAGAPEPKIEYSVDTKMRNGVINLPLPEGLGPSLRGMRTVREVDPDAVMKGKMK